MPAWSYLENGGRHAELIWHRRSGKDEISLHHTACEAFQRVGNYWHMLPLASQVRKAIWNAVNPHTGLRRIDEAFPHELREKTLENEMFIRFKNGSTWQALGSDNFNAMVGSPPIGIVYSEWALANPAARGYLRPIITENGGWQIFITTPRGKNHARTTFQAAKRTQGAFAQLLTINHTGLMDKQQQEYELQEYIDTYGVDQGTAMFEQEYLCSFEAAILGAVYGSEMTRLQEEGRITQVPHDPNLPVHVAMDIGRSDDTSIWWYQVAGNEVHILESISENMKDPDHFASLILGQEVKIDLIDNEIVVSYGGDMVGSTHRQAYQYGEIAVPHDARAKTFAAKGKSVMEQFLKVFGNKVRLVESLSLQDGIQAARKLFRYAYFDEEGCEVGLDALASYRRSWSTETQRFSDKPVHDWSSNPADAFRYMAIRWQGVPEAIVEPEPVYAEKVDKRFQLDKLWDTAPMQSERI